MVLHREVDAGVGGVATQRFPGEADLVLVLDGELFDGHRAHLVPFVVGVDLIADDPAPQSAMRVVGGTPATRDEVGESFVTGASFGAHGVRRHGRAPGRIGVRMDRQRADTRIGGAVGDQDGRDDDAAVAERLDVPVDGLGVGLVDREREAVRGSRRLAGFRFLGRREQAVQREVDARVMDAEGEDIVDHLQLQAFGAGFGGVGRLIGFRRGEGGPEQAGGEKQSHTGRTGAPD